MFSLALRHLTGADDPDTIVSVGMGDDQNPTGARHSDGDKPLLRDGMVRIVKGYRQRIAKYGGGFLEWNPMLPEILSAFARIPFKIHCFILPRHLQPSNNSESNGNSSHNSGRCNEPAQKLVTNSSPN
jgi:hypothetical protein